MARRIVDISIALDNDTPVDHRSCIKRETTTSRVPTHHSAKEM